MNINTMKCPQCGSTFSNIEGSILKCEYCDSVVEIFDPEGTHADNFEIIAGEIKSYKGSSTSVYIPGVVSSIAPAAFFGHVGLKSVTFDEGVVSIGESAFENCTSLQKVNLPNSLKQINKKAFKSTGITEVNISSNIELLGDEAFAYCKSLNKLTLCDKIFKSDKTFKGCSSLKYVDCNLDNFIASYVSSKTTQTNGYIAPSLFDYFAETPFYQSIKADIDRYICIKCGSTISQEGICENCGTKYYDLIEKEKKRKQKIIIGCVFAAVILACIIANIF